MQKSNAKINHKNQKQKSKLLEIEIQIENSSASFIFRFMFLRLINCDKVRKEKRCDWFKVFFNQVIRVFASPVLQYHIRKIFAKYLIKKLC